MPWVLPTEEAYTVVIKPDPVFARQALAPGLESSESSAMSWFFELALVLVRFDHVARFIVNANHGRAR